MSSIRLECEVGDVSRSELPGVSSLVSSDDDFEEFPPWSRSGVRSEASANATSTR